MMPTGMDLCGSLTSSPGEDKLSCRNRCSFNVHGMLRAQLRLDSRSYTPPREDRDLLARTTRHSGPQGYWDRECLHFRISPDIPRGLLERAGESGCSTELGVCPFPTNSQSCGASPCHSPPACREGPTSSTPSSLTRGGNAVKSNKGIETRGGSSQGPSETIGHEASHPKGTGRVVSHGQVPGRRKKSQALQGGQCNGIPGWGQAEESIQPTQPTASTQQGLGLCL